MDPFAVTGSWNQRIARWKNALGNEKAIIDHMGYPGGRFVQWQEDWPGVEAQTGAGAIFFAAESQYWGVVVTMTGTGAVVSVTAPRSNLGLFTRNLSMVLGTAAGDSSNLTTQNHSVFDVSTGVAMEFDLATAPSVDQMHVAFGMANVAGSGFDGPTAGFIGALLFKTNATANWQFQTGDGTALSAAIDTGVAVVASTLYKMRIEWLGSGVADDGVSACRAYINGTLVATILTNLPNTPAAPNNMGGAVLMMKRDTGTANRTVYVGPIRWTNNY
jgi:hypothetical protein